MITKKEKREALYEILNSLYAGLENKTSLEDGEFTIQTEMERTGKTYEAVRYMVKKGIQMGVLDVKPVNFNGKKTNIYRVRINNKVDMLQ